MKPHRRNRDWRAVCHFLADGSIWLDPSYGAFARGGTYSYRLKREVQPTAAGDRTVLTVKIRRDAQADGAKSS